MGISDIYFYYLMWFYGLFVFVLILSFVFFLIRRVFIICKMILINYKKMSSKRFIGKWLKYILYII